MHVWDFLPEFTKALQAQLEDDEKRWGDTWLHRTRKGQDDRTIKSIRDKFDQYEHGGNKINWLRIAGDCLICWIREQHPEIWPE